MGAMNALLSTAVAAAMAAPQAAQPSFHFMQIDQVIGGVNGDTTAQAIQLRMRFQFQCFFGNGARLRVHDAAGANPIILAQLDQDLPGCATGDSVLIATPAFASHTVPVVVPDFVIDTPIPESYFAAGSLTFEDAAGTQVYWRLSWGGDEYTGDTSGAAINDDDGEFGPPWPGPLPADGLQALQFQGGTESTANVDDYALTPGAAVFTNNGCERFRLGDPCPWDCGFFACQDFDNEVGIVDFLILLASWGETDLACDFDGGGIGITDLLELLAHWGPCD